MHRDNAQGIGMGQERIGEVTALTSCTAHANDHLGTLLTTTLPQLAVSHLDNPVYIVSAPVVQHNMLP